MLTNTTVTGIESFIIELLKHTVFKYMVYICMGITYTYCISGVASQIFGDLFEKTI